MEEVQIRISSNDDGSIAVNCPEKFSVCYDESGDRKFVHITEIDATRIEKPTDSCNAVTEFHGDNESMIENDNRLYGSLNILNSETKKIVLNQDIYNGSENKEYIEYDSADFLRDLDHDDQEIQIDTVTNADDHETSLPEILHDESYKKTASSWQDVLPNEEKGPIVVDFKNPDSIFREIGTSKTLPETWGEREFVRKWVFDVQKAVKTWVEQHRALIELKASQHQKEHQVLNETIQRYEKELELSQQTIQKLENDLRNCHEHYHTSEKQLNNQILFLQNWLQKLQQDLDKQQHGNKTDTIYVRQQLPEDNKVDCYLESMCHVENDSPILKKMSQTENSISLTPGLNGISNTPKVSPSSSTSSTTSTSTGTIQNTNANTSICTTEYASINPKEKSRQRYQRYTESGCLIEIIQFRNGSQKEIYQDGIVVIRFVNGDIQTIGTDGSQAYYYAQYQTIEVKNCCDKGQTVSVVEYEFANGQKEQHFPDGTKIVQFPDGTTTTIQKTYETTSVVESSMNNIHYIV